MLILVIAVTKCTGVVTAPGYDDSVEQSTLVASCVCVCVGIMVYNLLPCS